MAFKDIVKKSFKTVLILSLLASVVFNFFLAYKMNTLETQVKKLDAQLTVFANMTGTVAKHSNITLQDVYDSGMIGYPPYKQGTDYIIDYDGKLSTVGIKYIFDKNKKIIGWEEYPITQTRKEHEKR